MAQKNNDILIPPGYKSSPLGPIPSDWDTSSLTKISRNGISNGVFNDPEKVGEGYKLINVTDLYEEFGIKYSSLSLLKISEKEFKKNKVDKYDIFFTRSSLKLEGIAHCNIYLDEFNDVTYDGHIMKVSPKLDEIDPIFLKNYCLSKTARRYFMVRAKQNTMTTIGQDDIADLPIPLPSINEQTSIANLLSTWDDAISKISKLICEHEKRKMGLMQELLTGKKRLSRFHDKVELHPAGKYLNEISERYSDTKGIKVLSVTNSRGFIDQEDQFDRSVASQDRSNYKIVRKGQFAYNPSRVNVGSLDLLRNFESGILSPMYVVFETDQRFLLPKYFYYQLKSHWFTGHIPMYVQGSVRDSLSFDGLCGMKFFIPSIGEQSEIVNIFEKVDQEIELLQSKLERLKEQKKGLMQQLLTGKKRLKF